MVGERGLEPPTSASQTQRSGQLSYSPMQILPAKYCRMLVYIDTSS